MIKLDSILNTNFVIYQNDDYFKFSTDGVLLADFVSVKQSAKKIIDVGSGTGIISILMTTKTNNIIDSIEIQPELCHLFQKTLVENNLSNKINIINSDITIYAKKNLNLYDIVICNPPYYSGKENQTNQKSIARHEKKLDIESLLESSRKILKDHGSLFIIYNCINFQKVLKLVDKYSFSIRRIRFIHYDCTKKASLFMIECIKNGNTQTEIEKPMILYQTENNKKTQEYEKKFS